MKFAKVNLAASASNSASTHGAIVLSPRLATGQRQAINTPLKALGGFFSLPFRTEFSPLAGLPGKSIAD